MRHRLLLSVLLCAVAVLGAGAPGLATAFGALSDAQDRVDQAALNQRALALAHSLADERDDMVAYVAARGSGEKAAAPSRRDRVDRQTGELLDTGEGAVPASVRRELREVPGTRRRALAREGGAYATYQRYTRALSALQQISRDLARDLPGSSGGSGAGGGSGAAATAEALPHLDRAVEYASAARGLLRGALAADGPQRELTSEARQSRVRSEAAVADFEQLAGAPARETYDHTLTGPEIVSAQRYLARLTDGATLSSADRAVDTDRVRSTLSARIAAMRSVHSSLATADLHRLERLRDDEVTALELRGALLAACLLLALGAGVHTARSLTRPLAVLRRGAERLASEPAGAEPVLLRGRNDEFADVVHALNQLREIVTDLHERAFGAETDSIELAGAKAELTAEHERLQAECELLARRLDAASGVPGGAIEELGRRTLRLVERQLRVVESMEAAEADPDRLGQLFALDHLATRIRRHGEGLLLFAGVPNSTAHAIGPVPLLDVLRAALSEIEHYERVQLEALPPEARVSGEAADDVSHLVAELLDNAAAFSAPDAQVRLSGWTLRTGEIMLSVQDSGTGMTGERLAELNAQLDAPEPSTPGAPGTGRGPGMGLGLELVSRLAARHGLRVQLREQPQGGITAVVTLPRALLPGHPVPDAGARLPAAGSGHGAAAEDAAVEVPAAVPDVLPVRRRPADRGAPTVTAPTVPAPRGPARPDDTAPPTGPYGHEHGHEHERAGHAAPADEPARTGRGLPRRVPGASAAPAAPPPQRGSGGVDAEALRRQLGGFQRGSRDGHRDAAAETSAEGQAAEEEAHP